MPRVMSVLLLALVMATPSAGQTEDIWRAGANVEVIGEGEPDIWAAGASVSVRGRVSEDIWAAGAVVDVDARAGADVWAAGSRVDVAGRVGDTLSASGAEVTISAQVAGDSRLAGAQVTVTPEAVLSGPVRAAAARVTFVGRGGSNADLSGAEILFDGEIGGNVVIRAQQVRIGDKARIAGNLEIYSAQKPEIAPGAQISGRMVSLGIEQAPWPGGGLPGIVGAILAPLILALSAFILGLLAIWLARGAVEQTIDTFVERPGGSLLGGIVTLLATTIGAVLLVAVVIGLPLGLALLLAVPVLMILGLTGAGLSIGEWIANRAGEPRGAGGRIGLMALGIAVLLLAGLIPFLGGLLVLVAILMGLGALIMTLRARLAPETGPTGY